MEQQKRGRGRPRKVIVDDSNSIIKKDGFANVFIGHGTNRDPMKQFGFVSGVLLDENTLMHMFMDNKLIQKIIKAPAEEATKHWIDIDIEEDADKKGKMCLDDMDRLNAQDNFTDALVWSRLYGGSAIVMIIDDGGDLIDPLNEANIRKISHFKVYDKSRISFSQTDLYSDPTNINFGLPEIYQINPINTTPYQVHESRMLLFKNDIMPEVMKAKYNYWGLPILQGLYDKVLRSEHGEDLGIKALERLSQAVLQLAGMADALQDEQGEVMVKKRLDLIDMVRSILNTVAIDTDDTYELKNISLAQVPEMIDRFGQALAAAVDIPFTVLFGRSPAGMNSTGESDMENYYNMISKIQRRQLRAHCERVAKLIMLQKESVFKGQVIDTFKVCFEPLWLPSDKEKAETEKLEAETEKIEAETAQIYVNMSALTADEVRQDIADDWNVTGSIEVVIPTMEEIQAQTNENKPLV